MIAAEALTEIGRFGRPHGLRGEISAVIPNTGLDLSELPCLFVMLDGLAVPFFVESWRAKGSESVLLTLEGVDSQEKAALFTNKSIYAETSSLPEDETGGEGFYLDDLTGYTLLDNGVAVGEITGFDDSTANYLFEVSTKDGESFFVPAAADLITGVDTESRTVDMNLPEGLLSL